MAVGKNSKSKPRKTSRSSKKAARKAPAKQPIGRPAMFRTPEEMQAKIDKYFATCKPSFLMIDGQKVLDGNGNPVVEENPPTVVGLALFLGFESRQSLYAYAKKPDFSYTIKTAVSRMEEYAERNLFEKAKPTGSIFWLKNHGWTAEEKKDVNLGGSLTALNLDVNKLTPEKAKALYKLLSEAEADEMAEH